MAFRRLVYYVACTPDGFIAREDGSFDCFLFQGEHFADLIGMFPETFPAHLRPALGVTQGAQRFDTVLMGRKTYEVGLREGITSPYSPLRQYVVSGTMLESPDPSVELHKGQPLDLVHRLKAETGKDIWLGGGSKLAAAVFPEIDELILKINPVVIGAGIPLFDGFAGTLAATLVEHNAYSNGFIFARYALRSLSSAHAIDPHWRRSLYECTWTKSRFPQTGRPNPRRAQGTNGH